jgi:hypothetical protein
MPINPLDTFMKKSIHHLVQLVPLACIVCLFTGCAAVTRTVTDVGLGAGGAALGGVLSKGNPYAVVGGAAGGVLLGEGLHSANAKLNGQSYQTGYDTLPHEPAIRPESNRKPVLAATPASRSFRQPSPDSLNLNDPNKL